LHGDDGGGAVAKGGKVINGGGGIIGLGGEQNIWNFLLLCENNEIPGPLRGVQEQASPLV